jgi:hypothetical protein
MLATIATIAVSSTCGVAAQDTAPPLAPALQSILSHLSSEAITPREYTANVDLHVKLRVFPFIGLTLHGNSSYKRPGLYHFVFRGVPKAAEKFSDLNYDLGDPAKWSDRYAIAFAPQSSSQEPVVRLTPKGHGLVKSLDVAIDPVKGHLTRATWTRFDGGTITLVQTYAPVGESEIVARQAATIDIPHMRADVSADYGAFIIAGMPVVAGLPAEH